MRVAKNIWRIINTISSIWLGLIAHSFPRATLPENCSLFGTENVRGQISEHIFAPNEGYCLYASGTHLKFYMMYNVHHFNINNSFYFHCNFFCNFLQCHFPFLEDRTSTFGGKLPLESHREWTKLNCDKFYQRMYSKLSLKLYITLCINLSIIAHVDSCCVLGKRYSEFCEFFPLTSRGSLRWTTIHNQHHKSIIASIH